VYKLYRVSLNIRSLPKWGNFIIIIIIIIIIICCFCPHPCVCKRFSIFATSAVIVETEFLKSHVGQSAAVLEYSAHPASVALAVTI